jgi:hypothetical protein
MKILFAIFVASLFVGCGKGRGEHDSAAAKLPPLAPIMQSSAPDALRVFIFAGQSNMLGADAIIVPSGTQDLAQAGLQTDVDRSALFTMGTQTMSYAWGGIQGHQGLTYGNTNINGLPVKVHGPEVGFNRALGGNIRIVKYTDNYTALENGHSAWVRPGSRWTAWQTFVDARLATIGKPYKIVGVVWFQGIDDGVLNRDKASYRADLLQMISDVRARYGPVPFILGRSVNSPMANARSIAGVREAQNEIGAMPRNGLVVVDDLGPFIRGHHLTAAAQLISGQRFAEEYKRLR